MAKSSTKRKTKVKQSLPPEQMTQLMQGVEKAVQYVDQWKKRELLNLALTANPTLPICVPIKKDAYLVGRFGVKKYGKIWEAIDSRSEQCYYFSCRSSAVVYTLSTQTGHAKLARDILQYDTDVLRLSEQLDLCNYKLARAQHKKDYWRVDHFYNLISRVDFRLLDAKNHLEKSMHLAKYFKIWNSI